MSSAAAASSSRGSESEVASHRLVFVCFFVFSGLSQTQCVPNVLGTKDSSGENVVLLFCWTRRVELHD